MDKFLFNSEVSLFQGFLFTSWLCCSYMYLLREIRCSMKLSSLYCVHLKLDIAGTAFKMHLL